MKKTIFNRYWKIVAAIVLVTVIYAGCGGQQANQQQSTQAATTTTQTQTAAQEEQTTTQEQTTAQEQTAAKEETTTTQAQTTAAATEKSEETTAAVTTGAAAADGPLSKYPEPITATFVKGVSADDDWKWNVMAEVGETQEDNRFTRLYKDELNIDVKYTWIVDSSQYTQKLRLAISANDLPDFIQIGSLTDMAQLADAGTIIPIDDLWEQYATPLSKEFALQDGGLTMSAIMYNKNMMGVPRLGSSLEGALFFWYRTDWMETLNLNPPATMDEFVEYMKTVIESNIGGSETYGMMLSKSFGEHLEGFFPCFGSYPTSWIEDGNGGLIYGLTDPKMIDGLKLLAQFYKDGWLDSEYYVKDYDKAKEIIAAGHCGIIIGHQWASLINLYQNHDNDPNADWKVYPPPSATGEPVKYRRTLGMYGMMCINKNCKNPEALIKITNLYNEKLYGPDSEPDVYFAPTINGTSMDIWSMSPFSQMYERCDIDTNKAIIPAFKGEIDPSTLKGMEKTYYENSMTDWGWMKMFAPENSPGAEWIKASENPEKYVQSNLYSGAPTPTMTEKWTQLEDLRETTVIQIITGKLDPEQGYYDMIVNWKKLGGDDITREVNEWWSSQK